MRDSIARNWGKNEEVKREKGRRELYPDKVGGHGTAPEIQHTYVITRNRAQELVFAKIN
jgi:hypothetical protein